MDVPFRMSSRHAAGRGPRLVAALAAVTVAALILPGCDKAKAHPDPATGTSANLAATPTPTTTAPTPTGLSGTWAGPWNRDAPVPAHGTNTFVLDQQGQAITGTIAVVGATCLGKGTVSGTINGSTLLLHAITPAVTGSGNATADFTATVAGNSLTGTFVGGCSVGIGTGTFQATRQ
jgi:hypothetical protein